MVVIGMWLRGPTGTYIYKTRRGAPTGVICHPWGSLGQQIKEKGG